MKRKLNFKIKIIIVIAVCVAVVVAGLFFARGALSKSALDGVTYTVTKETYENAIEISGIVSAAQEQTLQALSDGTVMDVYVKQGDSVKKGDTIIQLDDTEQVYNLAKHDYDMATIQITGAARQVALMQTQRLSLLRKIEDRKVSATFDGIIADIDVYVGDSLEAKDKVGTIVDVSYLTADVEVSEKEVADLKVGQKALLSFPAYNGIVEGVVTGWPAIGTVTSRGATIVKANIRIDDYPEQILPYYSFSGKIQISPPEDFLIVSRNAIGRDEKGAFIEKIKSADGGKAGVSGSGEKIYVTVIPYGREYVRLESGVAEGDVLKAQSNISASGLNRSRGVPPPAGAGASGGRR